MAGVVDPKISESQSRAQLWKSRFLSFFESEVRGKVISLVALVFAITAFYRSCSTARELDGEAYMNQALSYRPELRVIGNPRLAVDILQDVIPADSLIALSSTNVDSMPVIEIQSDLRLRARFKIVNTGNVPANWTGSISTDTTCWRQILREEILSGKYRERLTEIKYEEKSLQLLPGDTAVFTWSGEVKMFSGDYFTLHLLVLYENPSGQLFDSYFIARYKRSNLSFDIILDTANNRIAFTNPQFLDTSLHGAPVRLQEKVWSESYVYKKQERDDLYEVLRVLSSPK